MSRADFVCHDLALPLSFHLSVRFSLPTRARTGLSRINQFCGLASDPRGRATEVQITADCVLTVTGASRSSAFEESLVGGLPDRPRNGHGIDGAVDRTHHDAIGQHHDEREQPGSRTEAEIHGKRSHVQ